MNNGMAMPSGGGIGAGELALLQNGGGGNNWSNNPFAYLIWLVALGRNGLFGGNDAAGAATVASQADAIRGVQETVSAGNLAACQNTNAIQASIAQSAAQAAACCCDTRLEQANQGALTRQSIDQGTFVTQGGFKDLALQNCQSFSGLSAQLAACCCENQKGLLGVENAIGMQTMQLTQQATANTQAILNQLAQQNEALLRDRLAEKDDIIAQCRLDLSQQTQNNIITAQINAAVTAAVNQITTICGCSCNGSGSPGNSGN